MSTRSAAHTLFPPRKGGLTDAVLKKELSARGVEDAAVLTKSEVEILRQMIAGKHSCFGGSDGGLSETERRQKIAQERKAKMMALDQERRERGHQDAQSIEEIEKAILKQQEVQVARRKQEENIDEVKHMNQVVLYAKCVTVRDAQVSEKKALQSEKVEDERKMDMAMELERLKALRMYEERELKRIEDRKKGAAVIRAQIEEREQERLRRIELKQQEQDAMLRHIDRMKDEDKAESIKKKEASRRLMEEVALANAEQIRLKNRQQEMEREEELQIAEYIREKQQREQEIAEEQVRIKAEKEKEIARLRSLQERAQDKQAELDALRARRAQEAHDREYRIKEREALERQAVINEDLKRAREQQKSEKEIMLTEQARFEKEEFERIIAVQKIAEEQERLKQLKERELRERNAQSVQKQIAEIEEARRKSRRDFIEEGNRLKTEKRERDAQIEGIRARKLQELERLSVPKQYRQELLKKHESEPLRPAV
mmetsp:Transcript_43868/g.50744  ORF Transcript_43868/g.50744 Transcript_43868/m.50744 type:complete len:487 (-) Transcript_43868:191-1651(-)|eukprot:CAMPEP_0176417542 /NCGR_PEP_ID=MMETSP0127-20121128/6948_1 /TAXON_ID=938130 /ORGANISM="Platyophrya macrostoma, Strain WH" /LENGTH=486 /DNA_ID=CAMNT_0017797717 /DNA_START=65 /DNA_END=1525 /DNA_ORIENTATION=-